MAPDITPEKNGRSTELYRQRFPLHPTDLNKEFIEESERLKTFSSWDVTFLDSAKLAKGGFYYTNRGDIVKCAYCRVEIGYWHEGDNPDEEHRFKSPDCPLVTGQRREEDEGAEVPEGGEVPSQDVCGSYGLEIKPFSAPERFSARNMAFAIEANNLCRNFEELGVSKISGPVSPYYATQLSRERTFKNWSIPEIQSPEKLAEAGFYYIGVSDNVLCFHCGGGLKNWEVEDDPWVEHALWFSRCGFVILRKGRAFVNECLAKARSQAGEESVKEATKEESVGPKEEQKKEEKGETSLSPSAPSGGALKTGQLEELPDPERKEIELCRICYVRERGIVFLPCGHFVSCTECAPSLSTCAVCRKPFEATVRAYLS